MKTRHISGKQRVLFLVEELPLSVKTKIEEHLRSCPACRRDLERDQTVLKAFRKGMGRIPPEPVLLASRAKLMEHIKNPAASGAESGYWKSIRERLRSMQPVQWQWATVAACFVLGLVGRFPV
jgi:anti-sigma factor RsiW